VIRLSCSILFSRQLLIFFTALAKPTFAANDMSGAEVILGVVAGGAGLASLSIQLAESALKLKRLYHSMKDAPETLKEIADEIEIMSLSLQHLERHRQNENHGADLLDRCIANCRSHTTKITLLTEKISQKIDNASLTGRLYASMRERDLEKLLSDLARARSALHLAVDIYYRAEKERRRQIRDADAVIREDQMAMCLVALQALQENQAAMMRKYEPLVQYPRIQEVQEIDDGSEGGEDGDETETHDGQDQRPSKYRLRETRATFAFRFRMKLPALFSSRVWEIARIDAEQGWDLCFRTYNTRPLDSLIFQCCKYGDLEGVKSLIRNGEASLLDVSSTGGCLVTVSIVGGIHRFKAKPHYRQSMVARKACDSRNGFLIRTRHPINLRCVTGLYIFSHLVPGACSKPGKQP
jgi:predicted nucleic acid-binding protein